MHHAVEILLARMESHPEDFEPNAKGHWQHWHNTYKKFFNEEERELVSAKLREINLNRMSQDMMQEMVADKPDTNEKVINKIHMSRAEVLATLRPGLEEIFKKAYADHGNHIADALKYKMKDRYNT